MISELFHVEAGTNYSTMVTQEVRTRYEPDLCSKNVDPGSSLPAESKHTIHILWTLLRQKCEHMHLRKRAFETHETALVFITLRSQAVSVDEKTSDRGCLRASDGRLEMR